MTAKPTIITFVLAIISAFVALWSVRAESVATKTNHDEASSLMPASFPVDAVDRIVVERTPRGAASPMHLVFTRSESGWTQAEPFVYPMDPFSMRQIAVAAVQTRIVDRLMPSRSGETSVTPAGLGFDPPEAIITYAWDGHTMTLELGRRGIAGRAYARVQGQQEILVVSQELHLRAIEMDPKEWRDRSLFREVSIESDRIIREAGEMRVVMERERRQWRMLEPVRTRIDSEALDVYMQRLGAARASGFIADQPSSLERYGLTRPLASVAVVNHARGEGSAVMQRLLIGGPAGGPTFDHYCMIEDVPVVLRVPGQVLQAMLAHPRELIDPTGTGVQPEDVKSVRIVHNGSELTFERDLERWRAVSHDRREVPAAMVQQLLHKLCNARAAAVEIVAYPRELETAVVTFFGFDTRPLDTVRVVHDSASGQWGLENGDDVLRVFSREFDLKLKPEEYGLR
ncbi:MAG TPA: DUF4340 domain-containing protein [Phycisphaerales bacterium]|nr:DUF4340 domain-containing protein [Phycisphaerales bacterium]HRQ74662.1 DUF4340 domain-containing protein [Phycisphaerales bacterium]